jgi:uncharacterized protein with HEPN domain
MAQTDNNRSKFFGKAITPALQRLLAISAVADRHSDENFDYSFTSIVTAFLIAQDPVSKWFQHFATCEKMPVDEILVSKNIEPGMFEEIRTTSERRIIYEGKRHTTYSADSIFGKSLQLMEKTGQNNSSLILDVRHIMGACIYGNEEQLKSLRFATEKMSNAFLNQIRIMYPSELSCWTDIHLRNFKTEPEISFGKSEDSLKLTLLREYNDLSFNVNFVSDLVKSNPYLYEEFFSYPLILENLLLTDAKYFGLLLIAHSAKDIIQICNELIIKVKRIIGSSSTSIPLLEIHELRDRLQQIIKQAHNIVQYTKNAITEREIYDAVTQYVVVADHLQLISQLLKEVGSELSKKNTEYDDNISKIVSSVYTRIEGLAPKLVPELKEFTGDLLKALLDLRNKISNKQSRDSIIFSLSAIAELLRKFMAELIRTFFDLVSWIRMMAAQQKFTLSEIIAEITLLQSEPLVVGITAIAFPKLSTPGIKLKFVM